MVFCCRKMNKFQIKVKSWKCKQTKNDDRETKGAQRESESEYKFDVAGKQSIPT